MKNFEGKKFKKGDKVVPHSKNVMGNSLEDSTVWRDAKKECQDYLYFIKYYSGVFCGQHFNNLVILGLSEESATGDAFLESDIEHYDETKEIIKYLDLKYEIANIKFKEKIKELMELQLEQEEIIQQKKQILERGLLFNKKVLAEEYLQSNINNDCVKCESASGGEVYTVPYFVAKEQKGVVTLVLKGRFSGRIYHTTKSKCMATDEFNIEVGKALCLARALGDKEIEEQLTK